MKIKKIQNEIEEKNKKVNTTNSYYNKYLKIEKDTLFEFSSRIAHTRSSHSQSRTQSKSHIGKKTKLKQVSLPNA